MMRDDTAAAILTDVDCVKPAVRVATSNVGGANGRWLGPVFVNEWLTTSRRWQVYAGRSVFVAALLVGLWSAWVSCASNPGVPTIQIMASVGQGFFSAIAFTQLTFTLMVAPASTAGAICQDRSSGKLEQLLTTELSDSEIILGKLAARLLPMLGLVTCACRHWP